MSKLFFAATAAAETMTQDAAQAAEGAGMNWLFFLVLAMFVVLTIWGHYRGFFKMIVGLAALAIAIVGTVVIGSPIAKRLCESDLQTKVEEKLEGYVTEYTTEDLETLVGSAQDEAIDELPLPEILREVLKRNNASDVYANLGVDTFSEYLCRFLSHLVIYAAVCAVVFLVLLIATHVVFFLLNIVAKLPILSGMNSLAGAVVGFVQAVAYVWFFILVVTAFAGHDWGADCLQMIRDNTFLSFLYENNLLLKYITSLDIFGMN